jgi:phospholipid/cholesterol/gamma-HCH transport system substrate-binding protein
MRWPNLVSALGMMLVAVTALAYMNAVGLSVTEDRDVRTASMNLPNTNGLVPGSRVLFRGVEIGRVTAVEPSVRSVEVTWNYKDKYRIPVDSVFRVDNLSALGETYLGITPRASGGPSLGDGTVLAAGAVTVPTTVDELAARVVRVLEQVNTEDVDTVVDALNEGLVTNREVLADLVRFGVLLESTIMSTRAPFSQLLANLQPLLSDGAGISGSILASVGPVKIFGQTFRGFLSQMQDLIIQTDSPRQLDEAIGPFLEHIVDFLQETGPDLKLLGDTAQPYVTPALAKMKTADLSQLMQAALATSGTGDGLEIRVEGGR